jgi:hypothetical protein
MRSKKIIVYLPARDRHALYPYLCEQAARILPVPLPSNPGNAQFLYFDPNWEPRFTDGPTNVIDAFLDGLGRYIFGAPSKVLEDALWKIFPDRRDKLYQLSLKFGDAAKIAKGWGGDEECDAALRGIDYAQWRKHTFPGAGTCTFYPSGTK